MNNVRAELEALVCAYVSGRIEPGQLDRLTELLRDSIEARDYFLKRLDLHAGLTVDESLWSKATEPARQTVAENRFGVEPPDSGRVRHLFDTLLSSRWRAPIAAVFAMLIVLAAVLFMNRRPSGVPVDEPHDFLAVMTDASNAVWKTGEHVPRDVGEAVGRALVELVSGRAEFQFDSGARVAIAGPAIFEFLSNNRARLHRGRLTALVPEPARGFTVEFDGASIVDQGTEFSLNCDDPNTAEVHVFDGEVLVRSDSSLASAPLKLKANDTKKVQAKRGVIADAIFENDRFLRVRHEATIPETRGDVRYLHRAPRSVLQGVFEHNEYILLFQERADLLLTEPVQVNAVTPGRYRAERQPDDPPGTAITVRVDRPDHESLYTLAAGTRLSSYFVHFDPVRAGGAKGVHREGSIRFKQRILGVIITTRHLVPGDDVLGHPGTRYDTTDFAIARNGLELDDRMKLGEDLHTVHLRLGAGTSVDHVRILVASDEAGTSSYDRAAGVSGRVQIESRRGAP